MRDVLEAVDRWTGEGRGVALATVIRTWGSSPRQAGAKMAIDVNGEFVGSVSGGCVEGTVIKEGMQSIRAGRPKLLHFGVADETAWDVGLACGGEIDVFLEPIFEGGLQAKICHEILQISGEGQAYVLAHVLHAPESLLGQWLFYQEGREPVGELPKELWEQVITQAHAQISISEAGVRMMAYAGEAIEVFFETQGPPLRLIIAGAVHISIALAIQAKSLGYEVFVVDPRKAFATENRFPMVDGLIREWPDRGLKEIGIHQATAIAVLTHDPKIDDPALLVALNSPAFYVGALGSQKTQMARRERLREMGLGDNQLAKLHGPIGLNLGGHLPEEIALSIMSEIVAVRTGSASLA
jgi:xanthine dehydrogenase accessory factor